MRIEIGTGKRRGPALNDPTACVRITAIEHRSLLAIDTARRKFLLPAIAEAANHRSKIRGRFGCRRPVALSRRRREAFQFADDRIACGNAFGFRDVVA